MNDTNQNCVWVSNTVEKYHKELVRKRWSKTCARANVHKSCMRFRYLQRLHICRPRSLLFIDKIFHSISFYWKCSSTGYSGEDENIKNSRRNDFLYGTFLTIECNKSCWTINKMCNFFEYNFFIEIWQCFFCKEVNHDELVIQFVEILIFFSQKRFEFSRYSLTRIKINKVYQEMKTKKV